MSSLPIPSAFVRNRVALTWREALWGLEHQLLRRLAETEPAISEAEIARKWLFLRMALIYEDKKSAGDRLAEAESVYADFGYPQEVEGFIRYMPADRSYDPKSHTPEENEARLLRIWKQYLDANACEFMKHRAGI
jgi:hypothetical protein